MGYPSPSHQWDVHRLSLFLLIPPWVRGTSISPRALHRYLLLQNQAGRARAWVEVKAKVGVEVKARVEVEAKAYK